MNPNIFRAYDVRGIADDDLPNEVVYALARAYGTVIRRDGGKRVSLGRDCRTHSPRLFAAFSRGLLECGLDVVDVGVVPSPLLYFSVFHLDTDGGVQITGSHNAADYNGFKMMKGKETIHGDAIQALRGLISKQNYESGRGQMTSYDITPRYVDYVSENLRMGRNPLRVAVDGGNGTGGPPAMDLFERLGVEVVPLHIHMDGTFPNHHPDPTVESNLRDLKRAVRHQRCDVGIAYDGDADRIGLIDDKGQVVWGDKLMILLARKVLSMHPGASIVGEVKCSKTMYDAIEKAGGKPIMSKVGHSIIKERMKEEDAMLAGEMSGHIFFRDRWFGFDDAIYVSGRVLEILSWSNDSLSELLADVPETFATPEIRVKCGDTKKFEVVAEAVAHYKAKYPVIDIDGARIDFGDGWGLIRASNTQPAIVLRAEAETAERRDAIKAELQAFITARQ